MNTENSYRNALDSLFTGDLYRTIHDTRGTHAGLWLDRYIKNQKQEDTGNRSALVAEVADLRVPETYKQFYSRWKRTLVSYGVTREQTRLAKTNGRMVIGLGDESVLETSIALHHTYGVPYIPGSALKGLAASYARQRLGDAWKPRREREHNKDKDGAYEIVFGDTEEAGYIIFFDALLDIEQNKPVERVLHRDTITVHHPAYYRDGNATPSDWDSPTPIPFLSATGNYLVALGAPDLENEQQWIRRVFKIVRYALAEMGIGAKTSSGYGRMTLETREEDKAPDEEIAVTPEPAGESLLKRVNKSSWAYELFAAWEQLPPDDDETIKVAQALVEKLEKGDGKKRSPKDEKRYQRLLQYLAQHT